MLQWFLLPPVAFLVILLLVMIQARGFKLFSADLHTDAGSAPGKRKPYACGHEMSHRVRPDYNQFFQFAFFFTLMHVVALVIATLPAHSAESVVLASFYLCGAAVAILILFRRW